LGKKKWIIIGVLVGVLAVGGIAGGLVYAQTNGTQSTNQPPGGPGKALADRVATILGLNQTTVENAFTKAEQQMGDDALTNWLNSQVAQGKMTQDQANQYKTWWQSRPSTVQGVGPFGRGFPGFRRMPRPGGFQNAPNAPSPTPNTQ